LVEVLAGLCRPSTGRIRLNGVDLAPLSVAERLHRGVAHIPEDRQGRGLILDFSVAENAVLGFQDDAPFARGASLRHAEVRAFAEKMMQAFDVRAASAEVSAGTLSGGNQQKLVVAREFARRPRLLLAAQPTRGVDVGAIEFIHRQLLAQRARGAAVLLVSLELSEIMGLSDRILVMYEGRIVGERRAGAVSEAEIGLLMTGGRRHD
jgi:general nucleoside transport system ATP-binding protein